MPMIDVEISRLTEEKTGIPTISIPPQLIRQLNDDLVMYFSQENVAEILAAYLLSCVRPDRHDDVLKHAKDIQAKVDKNDICFVEWTSINNPPKEEKTYRVRDARGDISVADFHMGKFWSDKDIQFYASMV